MEDKRSKRLVYEKIMSLLPEINTIPEGEGLVVRFSNQQELHVNLVERSGEDEIILAFYKSGPEGQHEQGSYEIHLDHSGTQAEVLTIRQENENSLYSRLTRISRLQSLNREPHSRSGYSSINRKLFWSIIPLLEEDADDRKVLLKHFGQKSDRPEIHILDDSPEEMTLEISSIFGYRGIDAMTVALNKNKKTASVVAVSGTAGRYPNLLPYPDGKEMVPKERESYSRLLFNQLERLNKKNQNNLR